MIVSSVKYDYKRVNAIYKEAFPKEERIPLIVLSLIAKRKGVEIREYFEHGVPLGFTYSVSDEKMVFVLFFAIDGRIRNKGYGSKVLSFLKEMHPNKTIALNVEILDESASNYTERVNRAKFYNKNGLYDTGYYVRDIGGMFSVYSNAKELDKANYMKLCKYLSLGFWKGELIKEVK